MYHLAEAYWLSAYICLTAGYLGALVFGTGVVAPLAVRVLDADAAAAILRSYWPRFYVFAVFAGLAIFLGALTLLPAGLPVAYTSLLVALAGLMTTCFYVGWRQIPAINLARDAGDPKFRRLHTVNVLMVGVGLTTGLLLLLGQVYVLPGQFTFWPAIAG